MRIITHFCAPLILALFVMLNIQDMRAQSPQEPCLPDCQNSGWTPAYPNPAAQATITLCGVPVIIEYRQRHACNIWYDVYIEQLIWPSTTAMNACSTSMGGMAAVMNSATLQLLVQNPMGFPPLNSGQPCEDNWRVMRGSCWTTNFVVIVPGPAGASSGSYMIPCNMTKCCLERYKICFENGVRTITETSSEPPEDCGPGVSTRCEPVCNSVIR